MDRSVVSHVALALLLDDRLRKTEFHFSIEHPSFVVRSLTCIVALEDGQFVAEEPGLLRTRMGDERFGLGEFQLELLLQEQSYLALDLLGFFLWPDNYVSSKVNPL
jgi:hypothetical protein